MAEKVTADIGFEKQIWDAACVLRGNMDASEYKNVVLGLIFLKYISDRFEAKYQELVEEGDGFEEDMDEYTSEGIFFVLRRRTATEELAFARFVCSSREDLPWHLGNGNNVVSAFVGISYVNCAGIFQKQIETVEKVEAKGSVFFVQLVIKPKCKSCICLGWIDSQRTNDDVCR